MDGLVSIIIPAYNAAVSLRRCLDSLLSQSYENIEIIIVNDGSSDETQNICEAYSARDSRIITINQNNSGVSTARNVGIERSTGEYITFVDADDYVEDNFIAVLVNNIKEQNADIAICGFVELMGENEINKTSGDMKVMSPDEAIEKLLREDSFKGYVWNKLFKAAVIKNNGLSFDKDIAVWEDVLFDFRYFLLCDKIVYVPVPVYNYIYMENSASHRMSGSAGVKKSFDAIIAKELIAKELPQNCTRAQLQLHIRFVTSSLATIRSIGYTVEDVDPKYLYECKAIIKKYIKETKNYLSKKELILSHLVMYALPFLMISYRFVGKVKM